MLNTNKLIRLTGFVRRTVAEHRALAFDALFSGKLGENPFKDSMAYCGRMSAKDATAIQYRMGAGFSGDVNRSHPFSIEPCLIDPTNPPLFYGQAGVMVAASNGFRMIGVGDGALVDIYGVTVRPFPFQSASVDGNTNFAATTIGGATPPKTGVIDILRAGYIMVPIVVGATALTKGLQVNVWFAASNAPHLQGGFESTATGGSTFAMTSAKTTFQGGVDASGIGELILNA